MAAVTVGLSAVAATAGLLRAWPQFARIVVRRDATGVSALTWALSLVAGVVWEAIGILEGIPALIVYNALYCAGTGATLVMIARVTGRYRWLGVVAVVAPLGVAVAYVAGGRTAVSTLGVALSMVMFMPQAVTVYRRPTSGVSAASWWLGLTSATAWCVYGLLTDTPVLVVPSVVMIPVTILILWRIRGTSQPITHSA